MLTNSCKQQQQHQQKTWGFEHLKHAEGENLHRNSRYFERPWILKIEDIYNRIEVSQIKEACRGIFGLGV